MLLDFLGTFGWSRASSFLASSKRETRSLFEGGFFESGHSATRFEAASAIDAGSIFFRSFNI
jgi:hypothetical protein